MLDVGFSELLVFGIIGLLVLGPDKLPEAARFAAKWYSKFKRAISSVQNDIDRELRLSEFREQMQNEMNRIQALEIKMQAQMHALEQQSISVIHSPQKVSIENKNLIATYQYINIHIPVFYCLNTRLLQQKCQDEFIKQNIKAFDQVSKSDSNLESTQDQTSDFAYKSQPISKSNSSSALEVAV